MKKRGFTLIELMIVLAIIAILAVVIVPKSGIFKKNAKTAGVTTNMNTVRAYLETKTAENALDADDLQKAMVKNFPANGNNEQAIKNPKDDSSFSIVESDNIKVGTSVVITTTNPDPDVSGHLSISNKNYRGTVIIYVEANQYTVYGVDLDGNLLGSKYAIEK